MKKIITTLLLGIITASIGFGATPFEELETVKALETGTEAETYFIGMDTSNKVDIVADQVVARYLKEQDYSAALSFTTNVYLSHGPYMEARIYYAMDDASTADAILAPVFSVPPIASSPSQDINRFRLAVAYYCGGSTAGYDVKADLLVKGLSLPTDTLYGSGTRLCIMKFALFGQFATTATVQETLWKLENELKPHFTTAKDALWWGQNVTSKVK